MTYNFQFKINKEVELVGLQFDFYDLRQITQTFFPQQYQQY